MRRRLCAVALASDLFFKSDHPAALRGSVLEFDLDENDPVGVGPHCVGEAGLTGVGRTRDLGDRARRAIRRRHSRQRPPAPPRSWLDSLQNHAVRAMGLCRDVLALSFRAESMGHQPCFASRGSVRRTHRPGCVAVRVLVPAVAPRPRTGSISGDISAFESVPAADDAVSVEPRSARFAVASHAGLCSGCSAFCFGLRCRHCLHDADGGYTPGDRSSRGRGMCVVSSPRISSSATKRHAAVEPLPPCGKLWWSCPPITTATGCRDVLRASPRRRPTSPFQWM